MTHIHYKFSSKLSYDTVVFDGPHTTLRDLKRQIMSREKLKAGDCDLQITNAQTKEEYTDDEGLIPKGSSVIVRRLPTAGGKSSSSSKTNKTERSDFHVPHVFGVSRAMSEQSSTKALSFFSKMQMANLVDADVSEEDKIRVMINQSSLNLNTKFATTLSENYTCYRCGNTGHHIRNCPTSGDKNFEGPPKIKKSTGIPRSFMVEVDDPNIKGVMLTNSGRYAIPAIDAEAYAVGKKEKPPFVPQAVPKPEVEEEPIPDELLCLICHELLGDAVVIPCCGNSYCDECIRTALLDSEDHVCPTCGQSDVSPDTLIANKFLRQTVNNFKKEQGVTKCVGKSSVTSTSKTLSLAPTPAPTPAPVSVQIQLSSVTSKTLSLAPTPAPTPAPVSVQIQLSKPLQAPCSQKDSLLSPSKGAEPTTVSEGPDVPPEATQPASAENSSNSSPQLVESQALISNNEDEEKTDDSAAVAPVLSVSDKDPSEAPKQLEPQVNGTEETEQLQTVAVNQSISSSDSSLGLTSSSNSQESACPSSSAPPPGGLTEPSTEQHPTTTSSSSSSSFSTTPSPLFTSPPPHAFVPTHQPHSSHSPGYQQTTPAWKLPTPQGAPIPSLCSSTCTPSISVLIPKEWHRSQREKTESSPHRHSSSHPKFSKSKSSRSFSRSHSRSASRSRSRSRPCSPVSGPRNFHSSSNLSCSYGYKQPSSHTSSSSPRGGRSQSKSSSHHEKSRHHSRRSSSSSRSSKRRREAGDLSYTAEASSLELERQSYLQWREAYQEWYDNFYSNFIKQFHQLPPPPPPPCPQDSFCPLQSRRTASPSSSEASSYGRSPHSQSSSDARSIASDPSVDSCSSDKANDRLPSRHSTPTEDPSQPRETSENCTFRSGTVTKRSGEANSQAIKSDTNQQTVKNTDKSSHSNHEQQKKKRERERTSASPGSKRDHRQDKRCNTEPKAGDEGHPGPHKATQSVHKPLKTDKLLDKERERMDKEESHLKNKQRSRRSQDSESRQDKPRKDKLNPSKGPDTAASEKNRQPGDGEGSGSRPEVNRKRRWEDISKNERESSLSVVSKSRKCPITEPAEPPNRDSKCLKLSDRKKPKPDKKSESLAQRNIWEGGMKVIPQKKISININLDGKKLDEKTGQTNLFNSEIQTQTRDQTGVTEQTHTEASKKEESGPANLTKEPAVQQEISSKATIRDDNQEKAEEKREAENKEMEDLDLWHCALTCVEDESLTGTEAAQDDCRDKVASLQKEGSARRESRGEARREEEMTAKHRSKPTNLHDGQHSTSKEDSTSVRSSCGAGGGQKKKTGVKTQEESSQEAEVTQNPPGQVSRCRWENGGKKQSQMEILNSAALPQPSVTVSGCETTQSSEQRQRSTERRRDGDRGTRGRDKEKETHSVSSNLGVAPSGGEAKRDEETRLTDRERTRESENQKERKRLKQGGREDERRRDDMSVQKRYQPSSSSVLHSTERRERLQGGSIMSWKPLSSRCMYSSDQYCLKTNRDWCLDLMGKKNSYYSHHHHQPPSNYREKSRPEHSPPSPYYNHSEDQDLLLFEPIENFQKGFPGGGSMPNRSRNESKAHRGEQRSEKTPRGGRETPEVGDGGGGGRQKEEKACKLEERQRSSSDSVRSSSSHKNDREDRRDRGREKRTKLQEVTA